MLLKTVLLGLPLLALLTTPTSASQYQYTEQADKDFHFRNRIQSLERQVETLKKEVKRLQAAQASLSQKLRKGGATRIRPRASQPVGEPLCGESIFKGSPSFSFCSPDFSFLIPQK